jgi:aspartyl-tRNA(Asn)/glutamyl-tRNA(Gln) amidotransferase subunit C
MAVTREDLMHIASLARLALDEKDVPRLLREINGILSHMEVLQRVDTEGIAGAEAVGDAAMPLRADGGPPYPLARALIEFAPHMRDGFFIVPRLATHDDGAEVME